MSDIDVTCTIHAAPIGEGACNCPAINRLRDLHADTFNIVAASEYRRRWLHQHGIVQIRDAEIARLTAQLTKAQQLGLEACEEAIEAYKSVPDACSSHGVAEKLKQLSPEAPVDGIGIHRSGSVAHVAAWTAIQGYARACGGDPDCVSDGRMDAVAKIEQAIDARASELSAAAHIDDDALERAIFDLEHAAETRSGVTRACNALRDRLKPLIAKARECETLREKLPVEEDRRSDEIRERHCAEERAHNAEAGNDVLKAEVVRMDAEMAAMRKQICRLVSGQAIESDHLCQHLDADVEARAEIARLTADLNATRIALTADQQEAVEACNAVAAERDRASAASADLRAEREAWKAEVAELRAEIARLTGELAHVRTDKEALIKMFNENPSALWSQLRAAEAELAKARQPATATEADALLCRWYEAKCAAVEAFVDLENLRRPDPNDSWDAGIGRHDPMPDAEKRAADTKERLVAITDKVIEAMTHGSIKRESPATPVTCYLCRSCGIDHTESGITEYPAIVTIKSGLHKGKIGIAIEWRRDGGPAWMRVIVGVDDHGFEIRENFDPCQLVVRAGGG